MGRGQGLRVCCYHPFLPKTSQNFKQGTNSLTKKKKNASSRNPLEASIAPRRLMQCPLKRSDKSLFYMCCPGRSLASSPQ